MTRQAIQLGWLPRLRIKQTSAQGYGQIYVGVVNWLLMIVTLGLTLGFGKSDNLAAAYGIAVSLTMLMTSVLLFIAMREVWGWNIMAAGAVATIFLLVDASFFLANMVKVLDGGYVPLLLAAGIYTLMWVWHRGVAMVESRMHESVTPVVAFMKQIAADHIPRVPGAAVFLTRTTQDTPPVMVWHVKHNRALHAKLFVLKVTIEPIPRVDGQRVTVIEVAPQFWRAEARYGFMERTDIPALLVTFNAQGCDVDLNDVTYYVSHETVIPRDEGHRMSAWQQALFALMERNAAHVTDFYHLPTDSVVEIGRQVSI
jgi:KUP system potassium uptake protein